MTTLSPIRLSAIWNRPSTRVVSFNRIAVKDKGRMLTLWESGLFFYLLELFSQLFLVDFPYAGFRDGFNNQNLIRNAVFW